MEPHLVFDVFGVIARYGSIAAISRLRLSCKRLYNDLETCLHAALVDSFGCLNIDFELIKIYAPEMKAYIEGTKEDQDYLMKEIEKFYYMKVHDLALRELFQAVRNYFTASSRLDLVERVMLESGLYSYYGSDGTGYYLPDLIIATRYADFPTFVSRLDEFRYASENSDYDDNLRRTKPLPDFMFNRDYLNINIKSESIRDMTLHKWSSHNINSNNSRPGNVIECNLLIQLAKLNKHKEILNFLSKYENHCFAAFYWSDDMEERQAITSILGEDEQPSIMAIPSVVIKDFNERQWEYENKLINSKKDVVVLPVPGISTYSEFVNIYRLIGSLSS